MIRPRQFVTIALTSARRDPLAVYVRLRKPQLNETRRDGEPRWAGKLSRGCALAPPEQKGRSAKFRRPR